MDRTFNYDIGRAASIFEYIISNYSDRDTNFHFEMAPELFDERLFEILQHARQGLFQFEIGIQTYNSKTLQSIQRTANIQRIESNLTRLNGLPNIHIHLDLIAGLPYEDMDSFVKGFDRLFKLRPHCLQLGFLKILKGSNIFYDNKGFVTFDAPPYEIISTPYLSFEEILLLKTAEKMLNLYYNSGRFLHTLEFLLPQYPSPFLFFLEMGKFYKKEYADKPNLSAHYQCSLLYDFADNSINIKDKKDYMLQLVDHLNKDHQNSGNMRKWRRKNL